MKTQENALYTIFSAVADALLVSLLWLLTSLPLITLPLSSACAGETMRQTLLEQKAHLLRIYFALWRENWRRLLPVGAVYVPVIPVMAFLRLAAQTFVPDFWWLRALYDGILLVCAAALIWSSALPGFSELSAGKSIAACLVLTGKHLFSTLTGLLSVALGCALIRICLPLVLLVPGAVLALLSGMLRPKVCQLLNQPAERIRK